MRSIVFIILVAFALCNELSAQQNFFNVPSSDITEKSKFFGQQQFNLFKENSVSNTTVCYGLGKGFEVGVNFIGLTYNYDEKKLISSTTDEQPVFPSAGVNAQKEFIISKNYSLGVGGQLLFPAKIKNDEWYVYLNNKIDFKRLKCIGGFYSGNQNYFDNQTKFSRKYTDVGLQLGVEYEALKDKLYLQADYLSGKTALSNLIVGGAYKASKKLYLSLGYQLPNYAVTSSQGVILEVTYIQ